jgi:hypothetical protein
MLLPVILCVFAYTKACDLLHKEQLIKKLVMMAKKPIWKGREVRKGIERVA